MPRKNLPGPDDAVVFRVAQLFLQQRPEDISTARIAEQVSAEFPRAPALRRESVYPLLREAVERGFVKLVPPLADRLARELCARFEGIVPGWVRVVETAGKGDNEKVAAAAAEVALELFKETAKVKQSAPVVLGLGPGRATLDFCWHFSRMMASEPTASKLTLVAITAGCPPYSPEYSSISFFNLFPTHVVEKKVGLFAETLVPSRDFAQIKGRTGVKEAFGFRDKIDLVITSMGDFRDEHDLLSVFLDHSGMDLDALRAQGWVGNVQYRPYSVAGPLQEKAGELRAVTIFELEDLVRMSTQKYRQVILIARQCGQCGRTRAEALLPLLTNPGLRVFTRVVMDSATALELLGQAR